MSHIEYTPCRKDFGRHLIIKKQQPSLIREKRKPNRKEKRKPDHETELMSNSQPVLMTLRNKTKIEREKGQKEKPTKKMKKRENREERRKCHTPFINTGCFAEHFHYQMWSTFHSACKSIAKSSN